MTHENTRQVKVGNVLIGGGAPVAIQSMSTFNPVNTEYAAAQINAPVCYTHLTLPTT